MLLTHAQAVNSALDMATSRRLAIKHQHSARRNESLPTYLHILHTSHGYRIRCEDWWNLHGASVAAQLSWWVGDDVRELVELTLVAHMAAEDACSAHGVAPSAHLHVESVVATAARAGLYLAGVIAGAVALDSA